jgi:putative component of membrane protein insertase Oxa1/YidC/SpoIIIJ protein YidD
MFLFVKIEITLLLILQFSHNVYGQSNITINEKIVSVSFADTFEKKLPKKKLMAFVNKQSYFNPLNYLGAGLLFVYQNVISEQIQADCCYEISCSQYTKLSIERYGSLIGILNGFNQWSECFNAAIYEHPPVYRNSNHKIVNHFEN